MNPLPGNIPMHNFEEVIHLESLYKLTDLYINDMQYIIL